MARPRLRVMATESSSGLSVRVGDDVRVSGFDSRPTTGPVNAELENRFMYHGVKAGQGAVYSRIREAAKELAYLITRECPHSQELELAITALDSTSTWATKGVARVSSPDWFSHCYKRAQTAAKRISTIDMAKHPRGGEFTKTLDVAWGMRGTGGPYPLDSQYDEMAGKLLELSVELEIYARICDAKAEVAEIRTAKPQPVSSPDTAIAGELRQVEEQSQGFSRELADIVRLMDESPARNVLFGPATTDGVAYLVKRRLARHKVEISELEEKLAETETSPDTDLTAAFREASTELVAAFEALGKRLDAHGFVSNTRDRLEQAVRVAQSRLDAAAPVMGNSPIDALKAALLADREYLLGWHANLAMVTYDVLGVLVDEESLEHDARWETGQEVARRLIVTLFADDPRTPAPLTNEEVRNGLKVGASDD